MNSHSCINLKIFSSFWILVLSNQNFLVPVCAHLTNQKCFHVVKNVSQVRNRKMFNNFRSKNVQLQNYFYRKYRREDFTNQHVKILSEPIIKPETFPFHEGRSANIVLSERQPGTDTSHIKHFFYHHAWIVADTQYSFFLIFRVSYILNRMRNQCIKWNMSVPSYRSEKLSWKSILLEMEKSQVQFLA